MVTTDLVQQYEMAFSEAHHHPEMMATLSEAVYDTGCYENLGVPFCMTVEAEQFGASVQWGDNSIEPHVSSYVIDSVAEWDQLPKVDHQKGRSKVVLDAIQLLKAKGRDAAIIGNVTGPISTASSILEPVVFYKELRKKNEAAHQFMDIVTDVLVEFACLQVEAGADIIALSDPSGTGEILGPKLFKEFMVPYLNRITEAVRAKGAHTIVHICGQMKNVYSEVQLVQADALSFDALVNLAEAKSNLENRRIMGNVSTYALEFAEAHKIQALTLQCIQQGADILSPACGLGMKTPLSNVQMMLETVKGDYRHAED